jgi:hypothetical protein
VLCAAGFGFEKSQLPVVGAGAVQSADFVGKALEAFPSLFGILNGGEAFQFFGQCERELFFSVSGDAARALGGVHFGEFGGEVGDADAAFLLVEPILVAAAAPGGNVVFRDGATGESFGENVVNFGQGVQPRDEFPAERAVVKAAI